MEIQSEGAGNSDIRLIERAIKEVEIPGKRFFGIHYDRLAARIDCKVIVYGIANDKANTSTATLESSKINERLSGTIHILAPSQYEKGSKSMGGQDKESNEYTVRILGHEMLSLYLESLSRERSNGWSYYSAPPWFTQGSQEYVASLCLTKAAREKIFQNYLRTVSIKFEPEISVSDPYSGGLVIMQFISETFGEDKILQIIKSEAATFDAALYDTLVTKENLSVAFAKWSEKKRLR